METSKAGKQMLSGTVAQDTPMKVLILRVTPNKMNMASYNLQEIGLAKALIRRGIECDVAYYCGKEEDHEQIIGFDGDKTLRVLWLHGFGFLREGIYPSLKKYIGKYDIIQVGGYINLVSSWLYRHARDKVVNYQGPYYCADNKYDRMKALVFDHTLLSSWQKKHMIVGTKSLLATEYLQKKGIKDVTTLGVGLDVGKISGNDCNPMENDFVKTVSDQKKGKYLLYVGVLEPRRNILFLLEMFKKIVEKKPDYKLIIIGRGEEQYVRSCFDYIDKNQLSDSIIYKERLEQKYIRGIYDISDAFLLPTRYEIFGMVLLEAMYFGLPVFTTYNGGSSVLIDGNNGVVIRDMSPDVWADNIIRVLEDDALRRLMGESAAKTISTQYTWDALSEKFIQLYHRKLQSAEKG